MFVLKLVATLAVSAWIVAFVDWSQFWITVRDANPTIILIVVVMRFVGVTISSYKWRQLLAIHGLDYPLRRLVRLYLTGTFLNHFLPTSIGGDAYRIYRTFDNERGRSCAVFAVFMERVTGLLALLALGSLAGAVVYARTSDPVAGTISLACVAALAAATVTVLFGDRLAPLSRLLEHHRVGRAIKRIGEFAKDFRRQPRRTALVAGLSFLFHANKLAVMWLVVIALGSTIDPFVLIIAIVGVEVVGLLPITLGGVGTTDGSFIYLVGRFGLTAEPALAAMLLQRVLNLPLSFAGAYFYALGDRASSDSLDPSTESITGPLSAGRANS